MLSHQTSGNGNHLVLIHGFCETSTCFSRQVLLLKDHFTLTTIDLPGIRNSPLIPGLTMEKAADAVHDVIRSLGIESCVIIGHSMGGYIALAYAKKYGNSLKGFGLLNSTGAPDTEERKVKRDQSVRVINEKGKELYVREFTPPLFSPKLADKNLIQEAIDDGMQNSAEGLKEFLMAMKNRDESISFLKETTLPVLFIIGKEDSLIPENAVVEQAASVKTAKVVYLENAGHLGMLEEPVACAEGLKIFTDFCYSR
jgi:pimeloyl-ACP methyl ester carboxylesterase